MAKSEEKALDEADKVLEGLSDSELDWMASRKIGNLGGRILTASQIRKLRGILKKKGIDLIVEGDAKSVTKLFKKVVTEEGNVIDKVEHLFYYMRNKRPPLVGGFNAKNKQFILPKILSDTGELVFGTTELIVFHEMAHLKHFEEVGEAYHTLNELQKEMYVWKEILANQRKWTIEELNESLDYINRVRSNPKYGNLKSLKI